MGKETENNNNQNQYSFTLLGLVFSIDIKKYFKILTVVYLFLITILVLSIFLFDYEMTNADIPGGTIAGLLLAYLIHIVKD